MPYKDKPEGFKTFKVTYTLEYEIEAKTKEEALEQAKGMVELDTADTISILDDGDFTVTEETGYTLIEKKPD